MGMGQIDEVACLNFLINMTFENIGLELLRENGIILACSINITELTQYFVRFDFLVCC